LPIDPDVAADSDQLGRLWTGTLAYCHFVESNMQRELDELQRRDTGIRSVWAGIGAAFGLAASVYSITKQEDADPRTTGVLALFATASASPAFFHQGSEQRRSDIRARMGAISEAREAVYSAMKATSEAANRFWSACRVLQLQGVPAAELHRVECDPEDSYVARNQPAAGWEASQRDVHQANDEFEAGKTQLTLSLDRLAQACRR
jgi:hypothetical protein